MGNPLENRVSNVTVLVQDDAIVGTNLNLALIVTDETPIVSITGRTKEYFSTAEVATDWGATSKVYKAAFPHFQQTPHNDRIKIGLRVAKSAVENDVAISVASEVATVTNVGHGLSVGEEVTMSDSSLSPLLNGVKTIATVPTGDTFTYAAAGVSDSGPGTIDYHTGDADITAALDAIFNKDANFFQLLSIYKDKATIKAIAAWVEGKNLKYTFSVEDQAVLDLLSTNVMKELADLNYNKTSGYWYHQSGVDAADVSMTVADEVVTVTSTDHGLRVGDNFTVTGAAKSELNGNQVVTVIVDLDNFKFSAPGAVDGADANNGAIDYFARYEFFETAIEALQLGESEGVTTGIGSSSWAAKVNLTGFAATPDDILSPSLGVQLIEQFNANIYKELKGVPATQGGKAFSGRTIKVQTVADWLEVRLQNADIAKIGNAWQGPLNTQLTRGGITPIDNTVTYEVVLPKAVDVPAADKSDNILRATVRARSGNEILKLDLTVTVIQ
jgi:hypothetical protein